MRRGRQRKLAAGLLLPWTKPPFGYRVDPDRPRDPAGVRIEESEAAIVREMFAWYAEESHSFCSLARLLYECGLRTAQGLERWNLASIRGLLTNPEYMGRVYGNRWRRRGSMNAARLPRRANTPVSAVSTCPENSGSWWRRFRPLSARNSGNVCKPDRLANAALPIATTKSIPTCCGIW